MGRRHLTPKEIIEQCKAVDRKSRMADRAPWSAMSVMCAYSIMESEGFKGQRISKIANKINEMEADWNDGKIDLQVLSNRLNEKAGWTVSYQPYEESDITVKKGTYQYWLYSRQLNPQNIINEQATRYILFFYITLIDEYGFGKERLTRVYQFMIERLLAYQNDKTIVHGWKDALYEKTGIVMEMPVDPLTNTRGSIMTGQAY